jgi:transposase InsO family protein
VLAVVDTYSRFSPVLDARFSYRGEDVVQVLDVACSAVGYQRTIRVDQGSEFVSRHLDLGLMPGASRWSSRGPGSRPTMPLPRRSTAGFGRSA